MITYHYIIIAIALIAGFIILKTLLKAMSFLFKIVFLIIIVGALVYCIPPLREYLLGLSNFQ